MLISLQFASTSKVLEVLLETLQEFEENLHAMWIDFACVVSKIHVFLTKVMSCIID